MVSQEDGGGELATLRERLSRLSEASVRINESLDLSSVLQGVLDSARSLTDATYGVITTVAESGGMEDVVSSGLTTDEHKQLWTVSDGARLFEVLSQIDEPLRVRDMTRYVKSQGISHFNPPVALKTCLSAPIRHGGVRAGHFFLAEKKGGREFTDEDAEILVMFAAQAALVISNARRYRDERRARADLETLINTTPVGVLVFDAKTATAVSNNREARRIADDLMPGKTFDQILQLMTVRRGDGRQVSFEELPFAEAIRTCETVRAEEVVFQVPNGRKVNVLINATPIRSNDGAVESLVVTLQDLTPLEDLERLRGELLAIVSHELRTPLAAIKGAATTALGDAPAGSAAENVQYFRIINDQADQMSGLIKDLLDVARIETGTLHVDAGPETVIDLVEQARDAFIGSAGRANIHIDLRPDLPRVLADRQRIVQVLGNLLSNAARYSPEASPIQVTAEDEGVHLVVSVADRGRGVSPERLPHLFRKFSRLTREDPEDSDTEPGWGLAISRGIVEAHGGRIWANSEGEGKGTRVTFTLPIVEEARIGPHPGSPADGVATPAKVEERMCILIVDDDPQTLRNVRGILAKQGYLACVTGDPQDIPRLMKEHRPALVLLDLVLPHTDGVEVMKDVIADPELPVIFLSAYGHEEAIARAFDAGADDYVVKPFSPTELTARIRAALRRQRMRRPRVPEEPFVLGDLTIDYKEREVTVGGKRVPLTNVEYRLMVELSVRAGKLVTYDELLQRVWETWDTGDTRRLRTAVKNIRRKLGEDARLPVYIFNQPGDGYRLGTVL